MQNKNSKIYPVKLFTRLNPSYSTRNFYFTGVIFLLLIFFTLPNFANAAISFDQNGKWETTFNCPDWAENPTLTCDGLSIAYTHERADNSGTFPTNLTTISANANNANGLGNKGVRFWHRFQANEVSMELRADFPADQSELWIRWYQRYEAGYAPSFNSSWYQKQLYIRTHDGSIAVIAEPHGWDEYSATTQGKDINNVYLNYYQILSGDGAGRNGHGWQTIMGGNVSDGLWHSYEVHLKMDNSAVSASSSGNGVGEIWIDGNLIAKNPAVNFSTGSDIAKTGWFYFYFTSNHSALLNTDREMYVDYDDMVVYNSTPSKIDAQGNPFIGPIGWINEGDATAPSAPSGLSIQ